MQVVKTGVSGLRGRPRRGRLLPSKSDARLEKKALGIQHSAKAKNNGENKKAFQVSGFKFRVEGKNRHSALSIQRSAKATALAKATAHTDGLHG